MGKKRKKRTTGKGTPTGALPPAAKAPVSLCMIVKNEERFLPDCLKSVVELVSEIVIVDTGSTDRTMQIAEQFGARLFQIGWENDFAKARNYGLEKATQPWILYLDADERLHRPYHDLVRQAVACRDYDAYYVRVRSEVSELLGKVPHIQAYPRIFRNRPDFRFVGRIHEQITPAIQKHNGRFALLDVEIEHLGYNLSPEIMQSKVQRNLESLIQQVKDEPDNAYARFQLGQTLIIAGEIDRGKFHLNKALEVKNLNPPLKATITLILANEEFRAERYARALEMIKDAVKISPQQRLGWFLLSECHAKLGQYSEAIESLGKYSEYVDQPFSDISVDKIFDKYLIYQRLAVYFFYLELFQQAEKNFIEYFSNAPAFRADLLIKFLYTVQQTKRPPRELVPFLDSIIANLSRFDDPPEVIEGLGAFCETHRIPETYRKLLATAIQLYPERAIYPYLLGNFYLKQEQYDQAESCYLNALNLSENVYEVYYNLAVVAIRRGDYPTAVEWFQQIRERFPEHRAVAERRLAGLYVKMGDFDAASQLIAVSERAE